MKKTITSLAFLGLLLINNSVNAQAFQKGNINLDLGLGFGVYGTTVTFQVAGIDISETDGASSFVMPLAFEYGISDKFGIGAQIGMSNYFISNDSNEFTESVKSIDFGLKFNYHLLNSDKNDLLIGIGVGGSKINWSFKGTPETYSGTGSFFSLYLEDRIFFSDNIGILFNLGYTGYSYGNMKSSVDNAFLDGLTWSLKGVNFGTGLAVKF